MTMVGNKMKINDLEVLDGLGIEFVFDGRISLSIPQVLKILEVHKNHVKHPIQNVLYKITDNQYDAFLSAMEHNKCLAITKAGLPCKNDRMFAEFTPLNYQQEAFCFCAKNKNE